MSFKDLNVEQVRDELAKLIANYPDRKGGEYPEEGCAAEEISCVYYKDSFGRTVSGANYSYNEQDVFSLVTPVCIVGEWVESFHPELKADPLFQVVLLENEIISNSTKAKDVLNDEVHDLLALAQSQQDAGVAWGEITL